MNSLDYVNKSYNKKLKIDIIKNGTILPIKNDKQGGVVDREGNFVSSSYHNGEWFKIGGRYSHQVKRIENYSVVYLGVFIHQWGHFILDSLSRAWVLLHLKDLSKYKYIFLSENGKKIDGNYLEAINLLGIRSSQVVNLTEPTKFKEIIIPEMATDENHGFSSEYPKIFKIMIHNANFKNIEVPNKIYLTRTKLSEAKKKEFGENIIEQNFKKNNYSIIMPENLTVRDQIAIFQKAEEIVCLNGSIPFDIVFGSSKLRLVVINKTSLPHVNMLELSEVSGIQPIYIDGYYEPFRSFPKTLGEGPFILYFGKDLESYFKKNKLKYDLPKKYPSKIVLIKYSLNCLKILGKYSVKKLMRKVKSYAK